MPTLHLTAKRNQRDFTSTAGLLADRGEPSWAEIEAAVASLSADAGALYLIGGEPTLRRDLFAVVENLSIAFPARDLVLVTNGRFFFYEWACDALAAVRTGRLVVEVWIASTRRTVHDQVVGVAESFDQASRGIQQLLARGQRTRVRVLVGRHNVEHLHEIAACLPDRFVGLERVVWDVATLAGPEGRAWSVRPDEVSGYLESALNLLRAKGMSAVVLGMPVCGLSEKYRVYLDRAVTGRFRDECAPCQAREECPGLVPMLAADGAVRVHPILPGASGDDGAEYEHYLVQLLARYVPPGARAAQAVLDAMCGKSLRNLSVLREFFRHASVVHGTDIDLDPTTESPAGTLLFRADLLQRLRSPVRYDLVALFKPPGDEPGRPIGRALGHLVAALEPGGHLLIVLAEHTDLDHVLDVLRRLDVSVLTSEPNALRTNIEPEHKWVIVCQSGGGPPQRERA